jgi:D-alanyl-D-alanine carboxypeptidase (penicillin-binding protein 5/6)
MSDSSKSFQFISLKGVIAIILALLIAGLGVTGAVRFYSPVPAAEVIVSTQNIALPGQFSVTFPDQGETAVGTDNFGVIASSPDQTAIPIASVAKIMTAYLVLKAYPLKPAKKDPV